MERPRDVVVAAARQSAHAVDGVRVGPAEHDHRNVGDAPAQFQRECVGGEDRPAATALELELLPIDGLQDLEPILPEVAFEEAARR